MPKEIKPGGNGGPGTCGVCGHTPPYHSMVCPKVAGRYCLECEMLLPRHYPWCSIGKRDNFFCWYVTAAIQKEVEWGYNQHMKNRIAQRAAVKEEPVAVRPEVTDPRALVADLARAKTLAKEER